MSFIESVVLDTFMLLVVLVLCLYLYLTRHFNYWNKRGIPFVKPLPLFGNLKEVVLQKNYIGSVLGEIYSEYKHLPYVGIFAMDKPTLPINDLDLIRSVLVKDSQYFIDHNMTSDEKAH